MTTIADVAGIDRRSAIRLRKAGIKTAEALMARTRGPERLVSLSEQTGIDADALLDITKTVELMGLDGVGSRYCTLLKAAGIHTVEDLAGHSPQEILENLEAANHRIRLVRRLPNLDYVESWVRQAREAQDGAGAG